MSYFKQSLEEVKERFGAMCELRAVLNKKWTWEEAKEDAFIIAIGMYAEALQKIDELTKELHGK